MLKDEIQDRIKAAMRSGNTFERDLLRVALGELQTEESRSGELNDAKSQQLVRKMIKSNQETLEVATDEATIEKLKRENTVLEELLPKTLGGDEVITALAPVVEQVKLAGNDGQATGVAMKHLKSTGANVDGGTVAAAVKKIRAS